MLGVIELVERQGQVFTPGVWGYTPYLCNQTCFQNLNTKKNQNQNQKKKSSSGCTPSCFK